MYDAIIIIFIFFFFSVGIKKGFIRSAYSMLSLIISVVLVSLFFDSFVKVVADSPIGAAIGDFFASGYDGLLAQQCSQASVSVVSVVLLYFVIKLVLRLIVNVADIIAKLPLIKSVNKLLGGVVGIAAGALWIVIITNVGYYFPQLKPLIEASEIVKTFEILHMF